LAILPRSFHLGHFTGVDPATRALGQFVRQGNSSGGKARQASGSNKRRIKT
jgi:hypothetical protein